MHDLEQEPTHRLVTLAWTQIVERTARELRGASAHRVRERLTAEIRTAALTAHLGERTVRAFADWIAAGAIPLEHALLEPALHQPALHQPALQEQAPPGYSQTIPSPSPSTYQAYSGSTPRR